MEVMAGERCGINLAGIEESAVRRGDALLSPGLHAPTSRIDCQLRLLSDAAHPLRHWRSVRLHHAARQTRARVALLQDDPIAPGESGMVQLVIEEPIAAAVGDRFVLREDDGSGTLGGGRIVDLRPPQRRRKQSRRLAQIAAMALEDPARALASQLKLWPFFVEWSVFIRDRAIGAGEAERLLHKVAHHRAGDFLFAPAIWDQLERSATDYVQGFHARYPQLLGPTRRRLPGGLEPRMPRAAGEAVVEELVERRKLTQEGGVCRLPEHRLGLDRADQTLWQTLAPLIGGHNRFRPPRVAELALALRQRDFDLRRVLKVMARQGMTVEIAVDYFVLQQTMEEVAGIVRALAIESPDGLFGAAQLRDRLGNGRKVAIWMLEHLDRTGLTARRGDQRIVAEGRPERRMVVTDRGET
jgi:selenocysteine-specific elongation factor